MQSTFDRLMQDSQFRKGYKRAYMLLLVQEKVLQFWHETDKLDLLLRSLVVGMAFVAGAVVDNHFANQRLTHERIVAKNTLISELRNQNQVHANALLKQEVEFQLAAEALVEYANDLVAEDRAALDALQKYPNSGSIDNNDMEKHI